ncbi:sensor domain-containing diguanylate cyclase [Thiomicrorhabdus arctica]|uniref:sensor domain-containing diguanylate cyclase n=1 Tax=Thiomicrorhabdus arctica TaxID=131540 RepID=UPI0003822AEE|nr:GGDEF domain-containing protein [Thiomicrorhabdus arctica]
MLNKFSCGLFTSDIKNGDIEYTNDYVCDVLDYSKGSLIGLKLNLLFSKASLIFLESYLYPMLLKEHEMFEIQLTVLNTKHERIPITANVKIQDDKLYWSIFTAINRDKLYQELLDIRDQLEQQAEILELKATTDSLTSLLNRRAAIFESEKLINQAYRTGSSLSFVMVDIDYFKRINDELGHQKGDEVLVDVGKVLHEVFRKTDVIARWGGEEFMIVLYDTPFDDAQALCQRLHQNLNSIITLNKPLTVSIGVAVCNFGSGKSTDLMSVLAEADRMLYKAKNNGRNRTEMTCYIK